PLPVLPGVYGAPMMSTLYSSAALGLPAVPTNILHLGGEDSSGIMHVLFPIVDAAFPVALLKSGIFSALDLTTVPGNFYTGGGGMMGGEVMVMVPPQLGPGPITITDGGVLHIVPGGGALTFPNLLRVSNGPDARASVITVDPGVAATVTGAGFAPFVGALE